MFGGVAFGWVAPAQTPLSVLSPTAPDLVITRVIALPPGWQYVRATR